MKLLRQLIDKSGMIVIYVILFIMLSIFVPFFFTWRNMIGLGLSITTIGMIACTMMYALAAGDLDLSVGSLVAFTGVLTAVSINITGSVVLGIIAGLLGGAFLGFIDGFVIAKLNLNPLIVTLAMMQIARGLAFIISGGEAVGITDDSFFFLGDSLLGIPIALWITIICFIVFGILLNNTPYGKNTLAIGGNKEAARLAGINVTKIKIAIFTLVGFISGLAGVVLASRMTSGQPNASQGLELDVISACVLGGVSLSGGVATISGVIVGVLIMGTVQNAMNLLNVPVFYQYVVRGTILLIAILLDKIKSGNLRTVS